MRAGFKIKVKDGSSGFLPCLTKRDNLCVRLSYSCMVPFSDHFASFDQNGTHQGIGRSLSPSCLSKMESSFHPLFIVHKPSFK
jgi:hypothetical protein